MFIVEETCDFCMREFTHPRGSQVICPSCGCSNPRPGIPQVESTMLRPAAETAVLPSAKPRPRKARK